MKTFPTLFKRTKTGAIQQWNISVTEDPDVYPAIIKEAGQLGGKLTSHIEYVKEGKNIGKANETTPDQQALSQAQSDWTKKHDEGYKSLGDLGIEQNVRLGGNLESNLQATLSKFNTGVNGIPLPMLAKTVDWNKVSYPCYIQPKLDGVRCLMIVTQDDVKFLSRSGKEYTTLQHIADDVRDYVIEQLKFTEAGTPSIDSFILDGEIYSDEISFQQIVAAVKKQRPDSLKLKFRAYDIVNENSQKQRLQDAMELVTVLNSRNITMVSTLIANSKMYVVDSHNIWVTGGNEGAMIRLWDGHYAQGQRSSHLLKVKEFDENEFTIVDFEIGQRPEDLLAVCVSTSGTFRAKMQGNAKYKAELLKWWNTPMAERIKNRFNKPQLTVKHFGFTDKGLPRFPIGKSMRDYE